MHKQVAGNSADGSKVTASLVVGYANGLGGGVGAAMPLACSTNEKANAKLRGKGRREKGQGSCGAA